jgi:hypothetical protein
MTWEVLEALMLGRSLSAGVQAVGSKREMPSLLPGSSKSLSAPGVVLDRGRLTGGSRRFSQRVSSRRARQTVRLDHRQVLWEAHDR